MNGSSYTRDGLLALGAEKGIGKEGLFLRLPSGAVSNTDPFTIGQPAQHRWAEWFAQIFSQVRRTPIHVRGVHYWLVGREWPLPEGMRKEVYRNGETYQNTPTHWTYLQRASVFARWLGLVSFSAIEDHRNEETAIHAEAQHDIPGDPIDPDSLVDSVVYSLVEDLRPSYSCQSRQAYHLEIVIEKSNRAVQSLAERYHANLTIGTGHESLTRAYELYRRIGEAEKPVRIFYLSDFDAAGENMPATFSRKIEWFLRQANMDADVKVQHVLLTLDQCEKYQLPRSIDSGGDAHKKHFEKKYGEGRVELDALDARHPDEFRRIVEEALDPYFDRDAWREVEAVNSRNYASLHQQVEQIIARHLGAAVQEMTEDIWQEMETPDWTADPVSEEDGFLYNSQREYLDQLQVYARHLLE